MAIRCCQVDAPNHNRLYSFDRAPPQHLVVVPLNLTTPVHHVQPDNGGRVMVQGLLTATLPTKVGGDLNFIAREMAFEFLRPVFTGETVTADVTFTKLEELEGRLWASVEAVCINQAGKEVLLAHIRGFVSIAT